MPAAHADTAASEALSGLINAGLNFLTQIALPERSAGNGGNGKAVSSLLETDDKTGRSYLRLPVPDPAALNKLAAALAGLLQGQAEK
jgi:hypothetical protein